MSRARKQDRFSSTLAVSYREPTSSEPSLGTCADISPSGMFIETSRPAARGVLVRFECVSSATQGVVRGTARVMWLRPHNEAQGKSGMGVRFVRLEPGSARVIEELIAHASNAGSRSKSDGPEARAMTEEPSVVLTAERTIGPTNRSSSVPPKGLRAPTLRGMYPTDVRSLSSAPAPPKERKSFDSGPPREPTPRTSAPPAASADADHGSSRPPADRAGDKGSTQALRERLDRTRRGDETPTESHRAPAPEPAPAAGPERDGDARITAPDGSLIDPRREMEHAAPPNRSLGATMHGATMHDASQPAKLSAKAGPRRGSDNTLGVPSPPPPPWKARHSERPPEPGGVEVIRAVPVTTDTHGQPVPAAHPEPAKPSSSPGVEASPAIPATPVSELPGAQDPALSDWQPAPETARPAMRPDRAPPDVSVPFLLPEMTDDQAEQQPGRNWIPWIVVGSGLLVTIVMTMMIGRPSFNFSSVGAATTDPGATDPTAPENSFAPPKEPGADDAKVEPKQVVVQAHVEPLGAKVSALGQTITSPGRLTLPYGSVQWPLRVRVELAGFGATELVLPRQAFVADGEITVHELYLELQPAQPGAVAPSPAPVAPQPPPRAGGRKPSGAKPARPAPAQPSAPAMSSTPAPGSAAPSPASTEAAPSAGARSPLQRALECLSKGDNACVLTTLGNSSGAREIELLIETYRATGDTSSAEAAMRRYLQVHPEGKRASQYRRALGIVAPLPEPKPE